MNDRMCLREEGIMKTNNGLVALLGAAAIAGATPDAKAAPIVDQTGPTPVGGNTILGINTFNDDAGASYNSLTADTSDLVDQLNDLNPGLTLADIIAQIGVDVGNSGTVDNGWFATYDANGDVTVNNVGGIEGITYDAFTTGQDLQLNLTIPNSLLNGETIGYGANNPSLVEASTTGIGQYQGSGQNYTITPEPGSLVLLGLGGLAMARRRRVAA